MPTFHRLESPTQTCQIAVLQCESGEIWGKEPRGGFRPTVQAYPLEIPQGRRGIEFQTNILPDSMGSPFEARWYLDLTPGVESRIDAAGIEHACVTAVVANHQP